jgi:hypothetical protein
MLNAGPPRAGLASFDDEASRKIIDQMCALHRRVALLAMTNHEFLDKDFKRERATYSDGTTVTVDWSAKTVAVSPPLQ